MPRRNRVVRVLKQTSILVNFRDDAGVDFNTAVGLAELGGDRRAFFMIKIEDQRSLPGNSRTNGLCIDVGIAIHVAANPGCEVHDARNFQRAAFFAIDARGCMLNVFVKRRHRPIQNIRDEEQYMLQFIRHRHVLGRVLGGLPASGHLEFDVLDARPLFLHGHRRVQHVDKPPHDMLFLAQNRASRRLSWVCGEYGFDTNTIKQILKTAEVESGSLKPNQCLFQTARLILTDLLQIFAPPSYAMHFLRRIDHLKVRGECPNDFHGQRQIQVTNRAFQVVARQLVALAPSYRLQARRLDELEQLIATLFFQ